MHRKKLKKRLQLSLLFVLFLLMLSSNWTMVMAEDITAKQILINSSFFDSDLREALKEISLQTGINIVVSEGVRGVVTIEFKDTPIEKALNMLLIGGGYSFRKIDDYYLVGLPDAKNPNLIPLSDTEAYYFQNITAETARALLSSIFQPYVQFDMIKNMATITAPKQIIDRIYTDFAKIDLPKPQVKIKTLITDVQSECVKSWGLDLLQLANGALADGNDFTRFTLSQDGLSIEADGFSKILASVKALEKQNKAEIHADPVIVTSDGKAGQLFVGEKRTVSVSSSNSTDTTKDLEAGTTVRVIPRILKDSVELAIEQKVSFFNEEIESIPSIRTTEMSSTIRVIPGQTAMIGVLTRKENSNSSSKTPILGDIPFLRFLFGRQDDRKMETELLIFLSVEVV